MREREEEERGVLGEWGLWGVEDGTFNEILQTF